MKKTAWNLLLSILFLLPIAVSAQPQDKYNNMRDSLSKVLVRTSGWNQRKPIIESLIDLSYDNRIDFQHYIRLLFYEANKAGDVDAMIEASSSIISVSQNLSKDTLNRYIGIMKPAMKNHPKSEITMLFFNMRYDVLLYTDYNLSERLHNLEELVDKYRRMGNEASIYDQIRVLNYICNCIKSVIPDSDTYLAYMQKLNILIDKLLFRESPVISQFYISSAITYTLLGKAEIATQYDRKLLAHINMLKEYYNKMGRKYRNYDYNYFAVYRRMLSNYRAISRAEVDRCYSSIVELSKKNIRVYKDFNANHGCSSANMYYYYAIGNYQKAAVCVDSLLIHDNQGEPRYHLLKYAINIYKHIKGSDSRLVVLYDEYLKLIDERDKERVIEKLQEAQILYGLGELKTRNEQLLIQKEIIAHRARNRMIILGCIIIVFLILLLINIFLKYLDKKRYNIELQEEKKTLIKVRDELIAAKEKAEQSERMEAAFLANMSHEIRTPLNAIVGFSRLLLTSSNNEEKEEFENIVAENTKYLLRLINDVLELSRLEAGQVQIKYSIFDLSGYLSSFAVTIRERLQNDNVKIVAVPLTKHYMIESDKERINQIFSNYAVNAIKYTTKGEIRVGFVEERGGLKLYVSDTGTGVRDSERNRVFRRFDKLDSNVSGTGLGLSITKAIVETMGGIVGFDSKFGEGSTFWAWLPIKNINYKK